MTTRILRLLSILVLAPCVAAAAAEPSLAEPTPAARVGEIFAEWNRIDSPGCAVGVVRDGELVFRRGYGQANLDHRIAITPRTVFDIGSTSKQFTAAAVALLAERGLLSLDDDVRRHLPELPDVGHTITLRHLIHHTSGLRDYLDVMGFAGMEFHDVYTLDDVVGLIARQKRLNFEPGAEHLYSNSGYMLLAAVVERVAGVPFARFLDESFFAPLGMADTRVYVDRKAIIPRRATGYAKEGDRLVVDHYVNFAVPGDGQVYTTVEDLAKWDRFFDAGGIGGEGFASRLLEVGVLNDGTKIDYAFGLVVGEDRGLETVGHGGAWGGFRTQMVRYPSERTTVICLCNLGEVNARDVARRVAHVFLADRLSEPAEPGRPGAAAELTDADLAELPGLYLHPRDHTVRQVHARDGRLLYGGSDLELQPLGERRFLLLGVGDDVVVSFAPEAGPAREMRVQAGRDEPTVLEAIDVATYRPGGLAAFAGRYRSDDLEADYRLEVVGDALRLHTPAQDFRVLPASQDFFYLEGVLASLVFDRDEAGSVTGFHVRSSRVRDLEFRRVP